MQTLVLMAFSAALFFFFAVAVYFLHRNMFGMLTHAENSHIEEQGKTVIGSLDASLQNARAVTRDYARQAATVAFVLGKDPEFPDTLWNNSWTLRKKNFDFVIIKDAAGNDLLADSYAAGVRNEQPLPEGFTASFAPHAAAVLRAHKREDLLEGGHESGRAGTLVYNNVCYYVCIAPVVWTSAPEIPIGSFTFGYRLTGDRLRNLAFSRDLQFAASPAAEGKNVLLGVAGAADDHASIAMPLRGLDTANDVVLTVTHPRVVYNSGLNILRDTIVMLCVVMVLFAGALYLAMRKYILAPIVHLGSDVAAVAGRCAAGEMKAVSAEFYNLCAAINELLENLARSRLAEEQSNISLGVLESILNGMDAYLYVSDPETDEILFINDTMRKHFGITSPGVGETCWQVLQQGITSRCPFCPNHKLSADPDAVVVWEEHNTLTQHYYKNTDCLIAWAGGKRVHLQHSMDITDLKLAEAALHKRLAQQELMSSIAQSFIAKGDMAAMINHSLRLAGEFMGVDRIRVARYGGGSALMNQYHWFSQPSPEEILFPPFAAGGPLHDAMVRQGAAYLAVNDIDADAAWAGKGVVANDVKSLLVLPLHVADRFWGLVFFAKTRSAYVWSDSDIHLGTLIASVLTGVISRQEIEEQLVRLSSIVSSSPQFISYVNREFQCEYINDAALGLTGYTREEIMEGNIRLLFDDETSKSLEESYLPAVLELGKVELTLPVKCKNGDRKLLAFSVFTMDGGRRIAVIATDVTEKIRLEKEMVAAREQAEKSSRAKGEFLSRMSHEMRTPMNAIIGMTTIAQGSDSPERKEYCLNKIADASKHLLGVINDILDISKIEADKFELSYAEFNFEKMLMQVTNVINFKVEEKSQILNIHVAPDVPGTVIGDEQRLSQVITNLLSNAVKFTPEHGLLTLSVRNAAEENGMCTLHISVSDTGIGISPEQQEKLFHAFEQADGGISRRFGGTGLGLAICKKLVELMGGRIWIESELGQGASFQFTIQVIRGKDALPTGLAPGIRWEDLRLMAVDDSADTRDYIAHAMQVLKLRCDIVSGGEEALALIRGAGENPYEIIFVDWMMPGMNGIELAREIRRMTRRDVVIIMISAFGWNEIEKEAREVGISRFIQKPLFLSQFVDAINDCLGHRPAAPADEGAGRPPSFHGRVILLAEDNEINREIAQALLEDTGITIHCAGDGGRAVAMYQENPGLYDMIFMDIHMPDVDGFEATRRIRALNGEGAATVPIVAMTANVFREDVEKCLAAGMNAHIGKPLDTAALYAMLRRFLQPAAGG